MISPDQALLAATATQLRECGAGRRECVAYWLGTIGSDDVSAVRHPRHTATATGYEVDGDWLTEFFLELSRNRQRVVAQLHTHPGEWVGHSGIDDRFAVVPTPGFVSVVVPRFAANGVDRERCGVYALRRNHGWDAAPTAIQWP